MPQPASFLQGFRSLEDIHNEAFLTAQQAIGLKHYHDFLERMPREEAAEIERTVSEGLGAVSRARPCCKVTAKNACPSAGEQRKGQRKLWATEVRIRVERAS